MSTSEYVAEEAHTTVLTTPQTNTTDGPCPASGLVGGRPSGARMRCPVCRKATWVTSSHTIPYHRAPRPRTRRCGGDED